MSGKETRANLRKVKTVVGFLIGVLVASPARPAEDHELCSRSAADPDVGIPACTRLLESGQASDKAHAFLNNRGVAKVRSGDLTGAVEDFSRALDRVPRFFDALKNRGIVWQMKGDFERAIVDFTQALRIDRRSTAVLNARGSALFSKQEYDRAIADFDAALAIDPNHDKALINRGIAFLHQRSFRRALSDFDGFLKLRPDDPIGYENKAALFMDQGDVDKAIAEYDAAIKLRPKSPAAYSRRGEAWRLKGEIDRSLADHNAAIDLEPTVEAYNNRALTWRDMGRLDDALADLSEAILLNPKYFLSYANRGELRRKRGDLAGSVADLDRAVELNPRSPVALTFRGDLRLARSDLDRAIADYSDAIRVVPDFVAAYAGRGHALERKGNLQAARADFDKALSLSPHADAALAQPAQELARARLAAITQAEAERARMAAEQAEAKRAEEAAKLAAAGNARNLTEAKLRAELEARERAAEARARAEVEASLKKEYEARVTREIETRIRAELEIRAKAAEAMAQKAATAAAAKRAVDEARAVQQAEAGIRAEVEAKAKAEFEARVNAEVAARTKAAEEAKAPEKPRGPRVALVIGNAKYRGTAPLANPTNDATEVAAALRRIGFEVIEGLDLEKRSMEIHLARFARLAQMAEAALVYYAGHGLQYQGQNFLVPVDARLEDEISLQFEMTRLEDVVAALSLASGARVLILDACRDNPLAAKMAASGRNTRGLFGQGLAKMTATRGMATVYATQANAVAYDGMGRNSIFTTALLAGLSEPNLEMAQVFRHVASNVNKATQGQQTPELSLSLTSEFYFNYGSTQGERGGQAQPIQDATIKLDASRGPAVRGSVTRSAASKSDPTATGTYPTTERPELIRLIDAELMRLGCLDGRGGPLEWKAPRTKVALSRLTQSTRLVAPSEPTTSFLEILRGQPRAACSKPAL